MVFRSALGSGVSRSGEVNYRLSRASMLAEFRSGELSREDVCDAHPELVRAARQVGVETTEACPVCRKARLSHVTYVFGPRLPGHGRCITLRGELERLARRQGTHVAYVVECCPRCSWNHLVRRFVLEDATEAAESG